MINKDGQIAINETRLTGDVTEKLKAIFAKREKKEIYIHADKGIPYGSVAMVMSQVQAAGITRIGLVTEPKNNWIDPRSLSLAIPP